MSTQEKLVVPQTALETVQSSDLIALFNADGLEPLLTKIEMEVATHEPDITTAGGRKDIASLAYKVSQAKTAIDKAGKSLGEGWRKKIDLINESRRGAKKRLQTLQDVARKPLDEWEAIEADREAKERAIIEMNLAHETALLEHRVWEMDREIAVKAAEDEERQRKEYERAKVAAQDEREAKLVEQAKADALAEAEKSKAAAVDAARLEEQAKAEKAEQDRLAAYAEADRIDEQKRIKEQAASEDVEHRREVNKQAVACLVDPDIKLSIAQKVIAAIARGHVPNVTINY